MPRQQEPKKLNPIQADRAKGIVSSEDLQSDIDAMISTGTLPQGLVHHTLRTFESAGYTVRYWFSALEALWKFEAVNNSDETDTITAQSPTFQGLTDLLSVRAAIFQREQDEAEIRAAQQANPVSKAILDWFRTFNGQEYLSIKCDATWKLMEAKSKELGLSMNTPTNLERIYTEIADDPDRSKNFERFFAKRDGLARGAAQRETEVTETAANSAIGNPSGNVESPVITIESAITRTPLVRRPLTAAQQQTAAKKLK